MWLFTTEGFFSVVQHKDDEHTLLVRCRDKGDAFALQRRLDREYNVQVEVKHTPTADYAYRMTMSRTTFGIYVQDEVEEIDYPNFKNAVAERQGHKRADIYGKVWATMLELQR